MGGPSTRPSLKVSSPLHRQDSGPRCSKLAPSTAEEGDLTQPVGTNYFPILLPKPKKRVTPFEARAVAAAVKASTSKPDPLGWKSRGVDVARASRHLRRCRNRKSKRPQERRLGRCDGSCGRVCRPLVAIQLRQPQPIQPETNSLYYSLNVFFNTSPTCTGAELRARALSWRGSRIPCCCSAFTSAVARPQGFSGRSLPLLRPLKPQKNQKVSLRFLAYLYEAQAENKSVPIEGEYTYNSGIIFRLSGRVHGDWHSHRRCHLYIQHSTGE